LRGQDSNLRPLGYEPNELPTAPPRGAKVEGFMKNENSLFTGRIP
jgi:hypothetical protein